MNADAREARALAIVARVSKRELASLRPETQLVADLAIDSPKALELLCDLEAEFNFELPEDAVNRINTVGDILGLLPKHAPTA